MKLKMLSLACLITVFCGCSVQQEKNYQGNMKIADNGIVEQSVLKQIKEDNAVVTFSGNSNDCKYEWTVFGDDISNPKDINLAVEIKEDKENIEVNLQSDSDFEFLPVLSIYLNSAWDCDNATVYDINNNAVCGASVTGSDRTILNFTVPQTTGTFCIMPDKIDFQEVIIAETTEIPTEKSTNPPKKKQDSYLTPAEQISGNVVGGENTEKIIETPAEDNRIISDGSQTEQDKYLTDPVPEGKPMPVEPENAEINEKNQYTCTFSVECSTILNNLDELNPEKFDVLPTDGIIFPATEVTFYEGESVYDVLQRICQENNIHMEASWTPMYNSAYVEGIHNLYEFDCGNLSGWMYRVDGWYPNYGCSRYQLRDGEVVEWRYTCDLGYDVGGGYAVNGGE